MMSNIAKVFLSVSISSVHLERLFSNIDINVTPKRNKLGEDTLEAILISKEDSELKHDKYLQKLFKIENAKLKSKNI